MGFLKGFGTAVCSILLFLALAVFGTGFVFNSTVLNAEFINSQVDKVDISGITDEVVEEQVTQEIPPDAEFLKDVAVIVIEEQEPLIKEQIHIAIDEAYAYFLEEDRELIITVSLVEIKESLTDSLWDTAVDYLRQQLAGLSDEQVDRNVENIMRQIPEGLLPPELAMLPEGMRSEVIKQYLKELGGRGIFDSSTFNLTFVVGDQVRRYFVGYFNDFLEDVPDSYTIDESWFSPETINALQDARTYINYFQAAYIWSIVVTVLLAGLIFLINWKDIKTSVRVLGIDLLIFGVLGLTGVLVVRGLNIIGLADVPVSARDMVHGIIQDVTGIALTFTIVTLVLGVALFVVSFSIRPREAEA